MSEAPAPEVPKPAPAAPEPKPTRRRRLWRWFKRWTRRAVLLALALLAVFSVWYPIHRALAYGTSARALAEARAELDAAEPGWRYEDIQAKYNASLPPADRNSFRWLERVPELGTTDEEREEFRQLVLDAELDSIATDARNRTLNRLPSRAVTEVLRKARGAVPESHPAVAALARERGGGAPLPTEPAAIASDWLPVRLAEGVSARLGLAGQHAALAGDHAAAVIYARATLNTGKALGTVPRTRAQLARASCASHSVGVLGRLLAWGAPTVDLAELQQELIAEANRDWLADALRGDRAALNAVELEPNARAELGVWHRSGVDRDAPALGDRCLMYAVRPYRGRGHARGLRTATELVGVCALPIHERPPATARIESAAEEAARAAPTVFHSWWEYRFVRHSWTAPVADCKVRAHLLVCATALACERFRKRTNRWPNALEELVPNELLAIPPDPFDGRPLRYQRRADGAVVYSVGRNQIDDNGSHDAGPFNEPLDIVLPMWNPDLRGLPHEEPEPPVPELP